MGDGEGDRGAPGALITVATATAGWGGGGGRGLDRSISVFALPHVPDLRSAT